MDNNNSNTAMGINSEEDEIDLLELIGIMWVHKWWIIGITGFAAVASIIYVFIFPAVFAPGKENIEKYKSTTIILVNENARGGFPFSIYQGLFDISSSLNTKTLQISYGNLAVEVLNEKSINIKLAEKYDLLRVKLEAEYDKNIGLLRISYTSNDPLKAKEISLEAYKLLQIKFKSLISNNAIEEIRILETKLEETRKELLNLEYKILAFQNEHGIVNSSDGEVVKYLLKEEFELYSDMNLKRDINRDLLDYLSRLILFVSLNNEIESQIFQLVEEPGVPDAVVSAGSSGKKLIIIVTMAAFFLSIFLVFILSAVNNIRKDPERMKKIRGIR